MRTALDAKLAAPFAAIERQPFDCNVADAVTTAIAALNEIFREHNDVKDDFPAEKAAAVNRLKLHFAKEFATTQNLDKFADDQARRDRHRQRLLRWTEKLRAEIDRLKAVISQA